MRFLSLAAFLAVPILVLFPTSGTVNAYNAPSYGFGCGDCCMRFLRGIHQHGPLFNYGPYYGYYPFKPYGPWDEYLRYDPFFYGDPYANWNAGNAFGANRGLFGGKFAHGGLLHKHGCKSCGFWHTSWLHGGWFRGHAWLHGGFGDKHKHSKGCSSCGGIAVAKPVEPVDAFARYSGIGDPSQSAVFYSSTPTLDPTLEIVPTAGQTK